jgi:ribosomal subunit interface protein
MNFELRVLHFSLDEDEKAYVDKKLEKFQKNEDNLIDLIVTITKEGAFVKTEAKVNFKWGVSAYVGEEAANVRESVDKLYDALRTKITKEKEKSQEKH